jgi:hypothetical protein
MRFVYNKPEVKFINISNHTDYYRKNVPPHWHKTQLHFRFFFNLEYNGYRSHAEDGQLSLVQTTAMVHGQLQTPQ